MSMYVKKQLQYCKVISLQLMKINGEKRKKENNNKHNAILLNLKKKKRKEKNKSLHGTLFNVMWQPGWEYGRELIHVSV